MMAVILAITSLLWAASFRVGVLVLPGSSSQKAASLLSQRLLRRLSDRDVDAVVIAPAHFFLSSSREHLDLMRRVGTGDDDEAAFRLAKWIDECSANPADGELLQKASLGLAIYHRKRPDELQKWVDIALRLHPQLELNEGEEWDKIAEYPEIGLQIAGTRARLLRECDLKFSSLPKGVRVTLNGFAGLSHRLKTPGPFWLRVEHPDGIFERWVGCATDPISIRLWPKELSKVKSLAVIERHRLEGLIVGLENRGYYFISAQGEPSVLISKVGSYHHHLEIAAIDLPFQWEPPGEATLPTVTRFDTSHDKTKAKARWYNEKSVWINVGAIALGAVLLQVTGILERGEETKLSGTVE